MSVILSEEQRRRVEEFRARHKTGVLTLVFTDMVGSTDLKRELGDSIGAALVDQQQQAIRQILAQFEQAEEIGTAGDSFFVTFIRPSEAVRFSLLVHAKLRELARTTPRPILVRIGIHMGEVFIDEGAGASKRRDILGIQVDAANRVMLLAVGAQTLMTRAVFDNARAVLRGVEFPGMQSLTWLNHGFYRAQGVEEAFEVCEAGEKDFSPLAPPSNSSKAQRFIIPEFEPVLGWQPALEVEVPTAHGWVLTEKLGEGGFGEVWKAHHRGLREDRIFKFCFRADRVRSLKREVTLFRLLREKVGEHPNIVRIHDVFFDEPPYYIVMEHFPARDLLQWCDLKGGVNRIPVETRLEIVTQVAEALAVAHESGIIHRDIKPSNILIGGEGIQPDQVRVKLTDFGIGQVVPENWRGDFTTQGLTEVLGQTELSSRTGTRVYMAPEVLAGRGSSIRSDIYSLGVLLYQLLIGDLTQPVTTDWRDQIHDPILADDLASCFSGRPENRLENARLLADRLRNLEERRRVRDEEESHKRQIAEAALERARLDEERSQHTLYCTTISLAAKCLNELRYAEARELLAQCPAAHRHWEWGRLQYLCNLDRMTLNGHSGAVSALAVSPSGKLLVTGGNDRVARVWLFETGELLTVVDIHTTRIDALAFHPDEQRFLSASAEGHLLMSSVATGETLHEYVGHTNLIDTLAFQPDGKRFTSGSWDKTARIWETETGREVALFEGRAPLSVTMDPDGQALALGCWDNEAHIWDVEKGKQQCLLKGRFAAFGIYASAFSADGKKVATGAQDGTARVWDTRTGLETQRIKGHFGGVSAVAFSPDGSRVVTGSNDRTARLWDLYAGQESDVLKGHAETVSVVAFTPDGRQIVTGSFDRTVKTWSTHDDRDFRRLIGHTSNVWSLKFSPDGKSLVTGSGETVWGASSEMSVDNTARVWNVRTGNEEKVFEGHTSNVWCVDYHPQGTYVASASADRTIRIWDVETGRAYRLLESHNGFVMTVAFSPDGTILASGGRDSLAILWDFGRGAELRTLRRHAGPVTSLAFHPRGHILATASWDHTVRLWDVASGQEIGCLSGHTANVESVTFSPDGSTLASGGKDNVIRLWDVDSLEPITTFEEAPAALSSLRFSPDGNRLVAGCGDFTGKVWDVATGKVLIELRGHTWFVVAAAFSPDGREIATGSSDTTAILWPTFPWLDKEYPGNAEDDLQTRIEKFKRGFWKAHAELAADSAALDSHPDVLPLNRIP